MPEESLAEIAAELYTTPPTDFVATRNARAAQVLDKSLAKQVTALRKPTIAAWVVNLFATERANRLGQAMQLAEELRDAQEDLDAATLSALSRDRRALTAQLAQEAASLASARGERVTDATAEAVQQTITAAFFDQEAAAAITSGRLLRDLEPSSASALDLDGVVGGGTPGSTKTTTRPADEVRARRERKKAEQKVHAAEKALDRAKRDRTDAEAEHESAVSRAEELNAKAGELEEELKRTRAEEKKASAAVDAALAGAADAADAVAAAEDALQESRAALEDV